MTNDFALASDSFLMRFSTSFGIWCTIHANLPYSCFRFIHSPHVFRRYVLQLCIPNGLFFLCMWNLHEPQQNKLAKKIIAQSIKIRILHPLTSTLVSVRKKKLWNKKLNARDLITIEWFVNSMYEACGLRNRMYHITYLAKLNGNKILTNWCRFPFIITRHIFPSVLEPKNKAEQKTQQFSQQLKYLHFAFIRVQRVLFAAIESIQELMK